MKKKISLIVTALFCLSLFISPVYAATKDELQQQKDDASAKKRGCPVPGGYDPEHHRRDSD